MFQFSFSFLFYRCTGRLRVRCLHYFPSLLFCILSRICFCFCFCFISVSVRFCHFILRISSVHCSPSLSLSFSFCRSLSRHLCLWLCLQLHFDFIFNTYNLLIVSLGYLFMPFFLANCELLFFCVSRSTKLTFFVVIYSPGRDSFFGYLWSAKHVLCELHFYIL